MQTLSKSERTRQTLLLIFSIFGMMGFLGYGGYNLITAILTFDTADTSLLSAGVLGALSFTVCATMLIPMLVHSLKRLNGKEIRTRAVPPVNLLKLALLFIVWIVSIVIAGTVTSLLDFGWVLAIPFFLAGALLPVLMLVWVAIGGLTGDSQRRIWAVFGLGMGGGTVLAIIVEYMVIGAIAVLVGAVAISNPEIRMFIARIQAQINAGLNIESLLSILAPYLVKPLVYVFALVLVAGIGPMIEEAIKPAVLWLLGKNLHSPAEGFALGALCGAGFALLEGMIAATGNVDMLGVGLATRFASTLMHITASGMVGWGIAIVRLEKRYWQLIGAYLLACALHGLWNGAAVTTVYGSLRLTYQQTATPDMFGGIAIAFGVGILGILLISMLVLLPIFNWRLRLSLPVPVPSAGSDIIAPLTSQPERTPNGLDSQSS